MRASLTPARARNVIESGPQAALFVLLRPSTEPVYANENEGENALAHVNQT